MKLNMPFLDLVAVVPLRDRIPDTVCVENEEGVSSMGGSGGMLCASGESEYPPTSKLGVLGEMTGSERRFRASEPWVGKISFRFAVFARDGRGGGAVPVVMGELVAANGSMSTFFGVLCLRTGGGFCKEFRTRGDAGWAIFEDVAVDAGGGGACLEGMKGSW
jgi:hypothetical protein